MPRFQPGGYVKAEFKDEAMRIPLLRPLTQIPFGSQPAVGRLLNSLLE